MTECSHEGLKRMGFCWSCWYNSGKCIKCFGISTGEHLKEDHLTATNGKVWRT